VNQDEYNNYPYTINVKFNRKGNRQTFPALVWAEYQYEADSDGLKNITPRYEANSYADLANLKKQLQIAVRERIDIGKKDGSEEGILEAVYERFENEVNKVLELI
jgi:hypothetical protein